MMLFLPYFVRYGVHEDIPLYISIVLYTGSTSLLSTHSLDRDSSLFPDSDSKITRSIQRSEIPSSLRYPTSSRLSHASSYHQSPLSKLCAFVSLMLLRSGCELDLMILRVRASLAYSFSSLYMLSILFVINPVDLQVWKFIEILRKEGAWVTASEGLSKLIEQQVSLTPLFFYFESSSSSCSRWKL